MKIKTLTFHHRCYSQLKDREPTWHRIVHDNSFQLLKSLITCAQTGVLKIMSTLKSQYAGNEPIVSVHLYRKTIIDRLVQG